MYDGDDLGRGCERSGKVAAGQDEDRGYGGGCDKLRESSAADEAGGAGEDDFHNRCVSSMAVEIVDSV